MVAVTLPWFVGGLIVVVLHFLSFPWIRLRVSGMSLFVEGMYCTQRPFSLALSSIWTAFSRV